MSTQDKKDALQAVKLIGAAVIALGATVAFPVTNFIESTLGAVLSFVVLIPVYSLFANLMEGFGSFSTKRTGSLLIGAIAGTIIALLINLLV